MESMGVVVRMYIDFLIITYPHSSCICSFLAAISLLFCSFLMVFDLVGVSLSEPHLDDLAGAFLWYIYICIHGQSIWSRVGPRKRAMRKRKAG